MSRLWLALGAGVLALGIGWIFTSGLRRSQREDAQVGVILVGLGTGLVTYFVQEKRS